MPRDGSGNYTLPPGSDGVPDTTVESAKYNNVIGDLELDANTARPVVAGGTGGATADAALTNLKAEKAMQVVTNFDSHAWMAGSFTAAADPTGTNGAPVTNHAFVGSAYVFDAANVVLEAYDRSDALNPGLLYTREKRANVWGSWRSETTSNGDITITKIDPSLILNKLATGQTSKVRGSTNGVARWDLQLGDNDGEAGADAGSDFELIAYNDAGAGAQSVLTGKRASKLLTVFGNPTALLGIVPKQYADAHAPQGMCRLIKSGANLVLERKDGKFLFCSNGHQEIPSAGLTLAPVAAADTLFFLYVKMDTGVMTMFRDAAVPVISTVTGLWTHPTDADMTMVGMARLVSNAWVDTARQRFVASWFNQRLKCANMELTAVRSTGAAPFVEVTTAAERIEILLWLGDTAFVTVQGSVINNTGNALAYIGAHFNGTPSGSIRSFSNIGAAWTSQVNASGYVGEFASHNWHHLGVVGGMTGGAGLNQYQSTYTGVRALFMG